MDKFKNLFSTPNKAALAVLCIAAIVLSACTGTVYAAETIAESTAIGSENAVNFAFADAGVDPVSTQISRTEFDYEMGQFLYEIEFTASGIAYEYWIKANDGSILKKEVELIQLDGSTSTATANITLDHAKKIALDNAGLSADQVTFTESTLDVEDGISVYEISFTAENITYAYDIYAETGAIYSKSKEILAAQTEPIATEESKAASDNTVTQIDLDAAKAAALKDAGVSASNATFTKAKLDSEDGTYDIEFYTATHEYDYEINATSGAVVERSVEALETEETTTESYISVDEAKQIAVSKAGLSVSQVTFKKAKLDEDDGVAIYEIEFYHDGMEYECEINAVTGAILDFDCERDDD